MKTLRFPSLLLLTGTLLAAGVQAGYQVRQWDVKDGLPQSSVSDVAHTPDGFLWIGTLHSGLARFDGVDFECYDLANTPQLGHAGIRRLLRDTTGRLWVNTYEPGLLVQENGGFTAVRTPVPHVDALLAADRDSALFVLPDNHLYQIRRGKDGIWSGKRIPNFTENPITNWVGAVDGIAWYRRHDGRIGNLAGEQLMDLPEVPGFGETRTSSLQSDRDGHVWITSGNRFGVWNGRSFEDATPLGEEPLTDLLRIAPAVAGNVWVETANRLRLCRDRQWIAEAKSWDPRKYGPPAGRARRTDDLNGLWIQVADLGLVHVRADGNLSTITAADGLGSSALSCMLPDGHGGLWTGYGRGGLVNVRPSRFTTIKRPDGLDDILVSSVGEDAEGAVWIGSANGSLSRWKNGTITRHPLPQLGNRCQNPLVAAGPDGRVWVATDGNGLLVRDGGEFRHVIPPDQFATAPRALLTDRAGRVWIATFNGIFRVEGERMSLILPISGAGNYPGAIAEAADGSVWIGTLGGELIHFTNSGIERLPLPDRGPRNFISALQADDDGSLWIGTQGGGLLYWNKGKFSRHTREDGLPEDRIWELLDDGRGGMWLGSGTGIARLDKTPFRNSETGARLTIRRFGAGDGLDTASGTPEFKPSCCRTRDGVLWFATAGGALRVDPSAIMKCPAPPRTWIERVAVNGVQQSAAGVLIVGPGSQSLDFGYTAPDFANPELVQFRHRLVGLDDEWISADRDRVANYRHVPPGDYRFHVAACNAAGEWWPEPAELVVKVRPHFWQTAWFRAACVLGLIVAIVGMVRYVSFRRLRARLLGLEQEAALQNERSRIAKDIHDDVGASLTEIALLSELAQRQLEDPPQARQYIDRIFQRARAVTRAVDDIVWSFNPANDSVEGLVMHIGRFAPEFLGSAGIRCRMDVPIELPQDGLPSRVRHHLHLAIKEALHNIVKHSGATEVWVRLEFTGHSLTIQVEDDGHGFDAGQRPAKDGDGLGNMPQRMAEVGGDFSQSSREGAGTLITFTVPFRKAMKPS